MRRRQGYTLVETAVATAVFALLMGTVMSITTEIMTHQSYSEADHVSQSAAQRAFQRTAEVLRKSGWSNLDGTDYPTINGAQNQLNFRILEDLDGNGYAFDATDGDLEWGNVVFTMRHDPDTRRLEVFDGDTPVWVLGSDIESVRFESFLESVELNLREIRVQITSTRTTRDGHDISTTASGSIYMRN